MSKVVDSYKLGDIRIEITETDHPQKLNVDCNDGNYHSEFTIRKYEYENYKRHMNQRIKNAYNEQYKGEEE
jgi:hypothetical protein